MLVFAVRYLAYLFTWSPGVNLKITLLILKKTKQAGP